MRRPSAIIFRYFFREGLPFALLAYLVLSFLIAIQQLGRQASVTLLSLATLQESLFFILLIVPGLTRSDLSENFLLHHGLAKIEFDKGMEPSYVAGRIVRAMERNKAETVLGSEAKWILRFNRFFPRLTDRLLARKVKKLYAV